MAIWTYQTPRSVFNSAAKIISDENPGYESWDSIRLETREMLLKAVLVAPDMVHSAINALQSYLNGWRQKGLNGDDPSGEKAWVGLAKYFCINEAGTDLYWSRVGSILKVFETVERGMMKTSGPDQFTIHLWYGVGTEVLGGVSKTGVGQGTSPIRQAFGFADEWNHRPWNQLGGPIHLNTLFFGRPVAGNDTSKAVEMGRVIVHEGTHKWAATKDILYKDKSYGSVASKLDSMPLTEVQSKVSPQFFDMYMNLVDRPEMQPRHTLPGDDVYDKMARRWCERANFIAAKHAVDMPDRNKTRQHTNQPKPLIKMAGAKAMNTNEAIADEQWLENADSYAWFARRMWKKDLHRVVKED